MNRKQRIILSITGIFIVLLALVGLTYAYFLTRIIGNSNDKSISVTTSNLELVYGDGEENGMLLPYGVIEPNSDEFIKFYKSDKDGNPVTNEEPVDEKKFTVTNNGNNVVKDYAVILEQIRVTYAQNVDVAEKTIIKSGTETTLTAPSDFKISITCKSYINYKTSKEEYGTCKNWEGVLPSYDDILFIVDRIEKGVTHEYTFKMIYENKSYDQSADMNKSISAKINIIDAKDTIDIEGVFENKNEVLYVELEKGTTKKRTYLDKDGRFKIVGIIPGNYILKFYSKSSTDSNIVQKGSKNITILKGKEQNISGDIITVTNDTRTVKILIDLNYTSTIESIREYNPFNEGTLAYSIISNGALISNNLTNESIYDNTFPEKNEITKISDGTDLEDAGIFKIEDDYGTSYYYRGPIKNNYVNFAGFMWRIVRINGDGTIRLILDGTIDKICIDYNEDDSCNSYAGEKSAYNTTRNNAYVGYMYGLTLSDTENVDQNRCLKLIGDTVNDYINDYPNQESCEINGGKWTNNSYEATHANVVSSTIKTNVDKFYETYIENNDNNKHYEKFLADTLFCNDKSLASLSIGADNSGLGFGLNNTSYKAQERLYYSEVTTPITKALPSLKCAVGATDNYSRFTSTLDMSEFLPNGLSINNDLKHPIALLTADELVLAGAFTKNLNQSYYLYDASKEGVGNISWWTGTPSNYSSNYARIFYSKEDERSIYQNPAYKTIGVRPVINLRANVLIDSGDGTKGDGAYTIKLS